MTRALWAVDARADKWWQDREPQEVIDLLEGLVDGKSDPPSVARRVCSLYKALVNQHPDAVTVMWGVLFRAVRGIGQVESGSLILRDFVLAIRLTDDVLDDSGEQVKLNGQVVWHDLPEFSLMFREYCICKSPLYLFTTVS